MDILFLIGRILYGGILIFMGSQHFLNMAQMTGYAESQGVPSPQLAVIVSGASLVLGALSILTGFLTQIGVLLIAVFFIPVTFMMHQFWKEEDENMKMAQMSNFFKNLVILGGGLMVLAVDTWPYAISATG